MQDTNSNQLLGLISLENLKHHLGSFTKYIVIFSFELYFFSVGGPLLFMKALSHFPAWEFLSKKTLLWLLSSRNHSKGLDGNHNYPSYIWKSCGRGKKCNFHCKSIRKEFCFIIAVVFFFSRLFFLPFFMYTRQNIGVLLFYTFSVKDPALMNNDGGALVLFTSQPKTEVLHWRVRWLALL